MDNPPSGTITFLFTDIEGSSHRWEHYPELMGAVVARHDTLLRRAIEANEGYVFKTMGDAFCAAFRTAPQALMAAQDAQRAVYAEPWGEVGPIRVRMALHTGTAEERDGDYFGQPLNRIARVLSTGHGGQTLLSMPTQELVRDHLPDDTMLTDLGEHRLKDLIRPERIFQVITGSLPTVTTPLRTLDSRPNNLPAQPTSLMGREKELSAVLDLLRRPEVRLLTFTGPGGTGKTRLSLQAGADLLDSFRDGVFFVNLAPITDPALFTPTIAQTLGIKEAAGRSITESLKEDLRDKQILLILDNFEQITAAAPIVAELLRAAPQLKVLATSRARLQIRGENEFPVPPLSLPDIKHLPSLDRLTQYDAVRLFLERALALRPDFEITTDNAPAIAEICYRLDGLPLAIELAAARIKILSPQAMLARLQNRLKLLTRGELDLPVRQQTLRSTIAWSYDLLDDEERMLFRRLAVFVGGCTIEAAETVCSPAGLPPLDLDVLDGLGALVDKSLLRQQDHPDGESQFWMLQTIGEYAQEKMGENGETEPLRAAHAQYYVALAEAGEPQLAGREQASWLARLDLELDNLRAAIAWCDERGDAVQAARLGAAVWSFMWTRGYLSEGRRWLDRALTSQLLPVALRAKTVRAAGILAHDLGDYPRAEACLEEALALRRALGDQQGIARALNSLGVLLQRRENYARAQTFYEEALSLAREGGDQQGIATALNNLGSVAERRGHYGEAELYLGQSLALARRLGDKDPIAWMLSNLAEVAQRQDHTAQAWQLSKESLALFQEVGNKQGIAVALEILAGVAGVHGQTAQAARLFGAAEALRDSTGAIIHPSNRAVYDRLVAAARAASADGTWEAEWAAGRALSLDQVLAEATAAELDGGAVA